MARKKKAPEPVAQPAWLVGMVMDLKDAGKYVEGIENDPAAVRVLHASLHAEPVPVPAPAPAGPSKLRLAMDARKAAVYEKRKKALEQAHLRVVPPVQPEQIFDVTVVEGRSVSSWAKHEEKELQKVSKAAVPGTFLIFDSPLPGWAVWALNQWRLRGSPSMKEKLEREYEDIQASLRDAREAANEALEKTRGAPPAVVTRLVNAAKKKQAAVDDLEAEATVLMSKLSSLG